MSLLDFSRINDVVLVRPPASNGAPSSQGLLSSRCNQNLVGAPPETILFLSWGDADARHIQKYTSMYTELYPGAKIILVRGGVADFFYRSERTQNKLVYPAVKMLSESPNDTLLIHVMSNAGSKQWSTINKLYFQSTGRTLSDAVTIIDSAPGRLRFQQTWAALSRSLPRAYLLRITLGFIFGVLLCMTHLKSYLSPGPDVLEEVRKQMNDHAATMKGARRCYIYSERDDIIGKEDVEDHARDAQQKGWAVELVKFQESTHVGHFKQNPEKYMETIEKTWFGRSI